MVMHLLLGERFKHVQIENIEGQAQSEEETSYWYLVHLTY